MISSKLIQNAYIELYRSLRNYLWDFGAVEDIVELEVSCYKSFPDLGDVKRSLSAVRYNAMNVIPDDDELKKAFDDFESLLEEGEETYVKLSEVKEVVQV